jgi:hypothetical protein
MDEPAAQAEFRARIIDMLAEITSVSTGTSRSLPSPTTRAYVIRRATEIMEARIADVISVTDLCRAIGVCPRTLLCSASIGSGGRKGQY